MTEIQMRLDQLKYLEREIARNEDILAQIDAEFCKVTATLSDMPKSTDSQGKWPALLDKKNEIQELINANNVELAYERICLLGYISTIGDGLIQQIFISKYIHGKNWVEIAQEIGGKNTADSVRMAHNRYLQKS